MTEAEVASAERVPVEGARGAGLRRRVAVRLLAAWLVASGLLRAGWARVAPVLSVVSPVGWIVLGVAVACLVAGFVLGWQEFVYLGCALAAALVVSIVFVFGRPAFRVRIELEPLRVVAGDRALGRMVVQNARSRTSTATRMELPVGRGLAEFVIPPLAPEEEHDELFAVPTQRRAVIVAGPAVSIRGDQLGLLRRTMRWTDPVELFVHPLTARLDPAAAGLVRDLEGEVTKRVTNSDISFHALRPYQPGDDRRTVHWRTSARTGTLMVRQFEETRRSQLLVVHSVDRRWYADDEEFELAVSVMASLGVQVLRDGVKLSVVTEELALRTRTPVSLLDDSCRLQTVPSRYATTREFARQATRRLPAPSVLFIVSGSLMPLGEFRSIASLFAADTQSFGYRAAPGETSRLQRVGELSVVTVGELADLAGLVRRTR